MEWADKGGEMLPQEGRQTAKYLLCIGVNRFWENIGHIQYNI